MLKYDQVWLHRFMTFLLFPLKEKVYWPLGVSDVPKMFAFLILHLAHKTSLHAILNDK